MCGIYGIARSPGGGEIATRLVDRMCGLIKHRGPDHQGRYSAPGIAIGNNRLAIVDLLSGDQPIFNEDDSLVIVFNGEIYNHIEIRDGLIRKGHVFKSRSDTETVLHAFEEFGAECVRLFNGMFAFAIWNKRDSVLFIARDRLGIKPLYVADTDDGIAFASEAKALLPVLPGGARPDWTAIYRYFSFGYVPLNESPFAGISKFPAGHYAWVRGARVDSTRYWRPEYGLGGGGSFESEIEQVRELLRRAVALELMSDVEVGVFLSGGLDSSAVALFAKENSDSKIHSFALRFEEATHDESADARIVAGHLGLEHHEFLFSRDVLRKSLFQVAEILDEPFGDSTVLPLLALSNFTHEHVKVVLTGWGGDEIFAGYPTYKAHLMAGAYRKLPKVVTGGIIPAVVRRLPVSDKYMSFEFKAKRFIGGMGMPPELQHFIWMGYFDDEEKARLFDGRILEQVTGETLDPVRRENDNIAGDDIVSRIMHLDALFFLQGNGLFQADRMTMAASLEARVPLLNNALIEHVNALPASIKMRGGKPKELLRRVLENDLPSRILHKPKKGFGPPSSAWTKGVFSDVLEDLFSRERVEEHGIFQYDEITRLIGEHKNRKADHGRKLWALLSFQLWHDRFITGGYPIQSMDGNY